LEAGDQIIQSKKGFGSAVHSPYLSSDAWLNEISLI